MRTINKRPPPNELVEWRQARNAAADDATWPYNYDALRRSPPVIDAVNHRLFDEQGGICAYTGIRLAFLDDGEPLFHIEHLKAQDHCARGEDTEYGNLVACWPEPNRKIGAEYGAVKKDKWPFPVDAAKFVSPLLANCSARFVYRKTGEIEAALASDTAAAETIGRLALNHKELRAIRRSAIRGALQPRRGQRLKLTEARKIKTEMERAETELNSGQNVSLRAFCFVIKPFIDREVRKLTAIQSNKANN